MAEGDLLQRFLFERWPVRGHFVRLDALPELGRTYMGYARMLAARDGKHKCKRASALADQARALLTTLDMQPFAQRAVELVQAFSEGHKCAM